MADQNKCSNAKRIAHFLYVGVIAAGAVLPLATTAFAAVETPEATTLALSPSSGSVLESSIVNVRGSKNATASFAPPVADAQGVFPTLEDYVGKLTCTGCGKHCPLTAPQCGIGDQQYEQAVTTYTSATTSAASVPVAEPSSQEESQASGAEASEPAASSKPEVIIQESPVAEESSSAATSAPEPSISTEASAPEALISQQEAMTNEIDAAKSAAETSDTHDILGDVMEWAPFGGLVVGGVYYTIFAPKDKKRERGDHR